MSRRAPRIPKAPPPPARSGRLYVLLAKADIARFRFLLEARDNLALFTVLDPHRAALKIVFPPAREAEVRDALAQIATEIPLCVVEPRLSLP